MGADAQLKDRSASGEFGQEVDCGVEDVGSEHVRQRLVISRGDSLAEVIIGHASTVALDHRRWPEMVWPNRFRIAGVAEFGQPETGSPVISESAVRPPQCPSH